MESIFAPVIGLTFACAVYLLLQRSLGQLIIGMALLSNAVNLFIFVASGFGEGAAPIVNPATNATEPGAGDPVPQALILTAIVIGFGVLAFFITLAYRVYRLKGTDDLAALSEADITESVTGPSKPQGTDS